MHCMAEMTVSHNTYSCCYLSSPWLPLLAHCLFFALWQHFFVKLRSPPVRLFCLRTHLVRTTLALPALPSTSSLVGPARLRIRLALCHLGGCIWRSTYTFNGLCTPRPRTTPPYARTPHYAFCLHHTCAACLPTHTYTLCLLPPTTPPTCAAHHTTHPATRAAASPTPPPAGISPTLAPPHPLHLPHLSAHAACFSSRSPPPARTTTTPLLILPLPATLALPVYGQFEP